MTRFFLPLLFLASSLPTVAAAGLFDETRNTTTFFSFDEVSIPFTQNLRLEMRKPEKHSSNPVVARGPDGSVDDWAVQFYGSIIRDPDSGKYKAWYCAVSKEERANKNAIGPSAIWRVAYAESDDGISWTKPNLGLVESQGSRENNLCQMDPHLGILNLKVLYEPDDPNPEHRYKMGAHVWTPKSATRRNGTLAPFVSADGKSWKLLVEAAEPVEGELAEKDTVIPPLHFEPVGGLYKWDGLYHLSGQNAIMTARPYHGRVSRTFVSPDFLHWSEESAIQAVRTHQHVLLGPGKSREGEQTHEGISVWNRGNVLVGISGMWHGTPEWKDLTIDLGFVVSNDGIRFREPMEEWTFLHRGNDGDWDQGGLLQGQGFENIGEKTFVYYGAWDPRNWEQSPPRGGIGIAQLPRDRFGDLIPDETTKGPGDYQMEETVCSFMTKSFETAGNGETLFLNASGLSNDARIRIEVLDHRMNPVPGFSGKSAAVITKPGFQTPVIFGEQSALNALPERVRLRVTFRGAERTGARFHALYLR
ncbi:MAG: hypothetical protein MI807_00415 [Verrucomicrobiales bacterium]|nr:hypothetical protein [Verrucomicrobiales bacterium]